MQRSRRASKFGEGAGRSLLSQEHLLMTSRIPRPALGQRSAGANILEPTGRLVPLTRSRLERVLAFALPSVLEAPSAGSKCIKKATNDSAAYERRR